MPVRMYPDEFFVRGKEDSRTNLDRPVQRCDRGGPQSFEGQARDLRPGPPSLPLPVKAGNRWGMAKRLPDSARFSRPESLPSTAVLPVLQPSGPVGWPFSQV